MGRSPRERNARKMRNAKRLRNICWYTEEIVTRYLVRVSNESCCYSVGKRYDSRDLHEDTR